ncbi:MAG: LLM class flavin-dependent oxidoreductase, partial [Sphingobacterium sp.]
YDYGRSRHGHLIIGSVEESVEKILLFKEEFGLTRFSAHMDVGCPAHALMMKAIEIYGDQIMPKVKAYSK